jgi:hypothetical protein
VGRAAFHLLLVILTVLFWVWSGAASLGVGYLVVIAPLLLIGIALRTRRERKLSVHHRFTFWTAALYPAGVAVLLGLAVLFVPEP